MAKGAESEEGKKKCNFHYQENGIDVFFPVLPLIITNPPGHQI